MTAPARGADELEASFAALGIAPPEEEAYNPEEPVYEVWEENWASVQAFLKCQTQWTYGAMGGCIGLNYPAVEVVLRLTKVHNPRQVFEDIQLMEIVALKVLNDVK